MDVQRDGLGAQRRLPRRLAFVADVLVAVAETAVQLVGADALQVDESMLDPQRLRDRLSWFACSCWLTDTKRRSR